MALRRLGGVALALALAFGAACSTSLPASAQKSAKREGPAAVAPARIGGVEYRAVHWGRERGLPQDGGYLAAVDAASGRELWLLRVYETAYDAQRERDVQDTFIVEVKVDGTGRRLAVRDELGRVWIVDPATRQVQQQR